MYLRSTSSVESFRRKWTKKELKPQLEQPCHKILPSKLSTLENWPKWLLVTTFVILKSGFAKREGKDGLLMHAFFSTMFSLFFYPFFFFICSPFSLSFLLLSYRGSFLLSSMATSPFYSELIPWDFSLLPLELYQLFLVCYGHLFKIVQQYIGYLATTIAQYIFTLLLLISWQNSLLFDFATNLYLWVQMDKDLATSSPTSMACNMWS